MVKENLNVDNSNAAKLPMRVFDSGRGKVMAGEAWRHQMIADDNEL